MYEDYLRNTQTYVLLENKIYAVFVDNVDLAKWQIKYLNTQYINGQPFYDANPIFSACHVENNSILKIVLDEDMPELVYFQSDFDGQIMHNYITSVKNIMADLNTIFSAYRGT